MRTYLVVAHRTLVGRHLIDHARDLAAEEPTRFHLVVPIYHPTNRPWADGEVEAAARRRLEEGIEVFTDAGLDATGEVGDSNPVYAASTALRNLRLPCDGVILSTLPARISAWLHLDVPSRMRREIDLPVVHLVATSSREAAA